MATRTIRFGLMLFAGVALAGGRASARGDADGGQQRLFDGGAAEPFRLAFPADVPAVPQPRTMGRSTADLYHFTSEEAARAAERSGTAPAAWWWPWGDGIPFDPEVPAPVRRQLEGDLDFVKKLKGSGASPLHREIFGPVSGSAYRRYFESRVKGVGFDDCGPNAVACVSPLFDPSKMWLTQNYVTFQHPRVARLMVAFHEARHTEVDRGFWRHATCPTPFRDAQGRDVKSIWTGASLAGEPACDETPYGAYGSSTVMLKNIQRFCSNCTDKVRMDAGLYGDDQLGRITDPEARRRMLADFGP